MGAKVRIIIALFALLVIAVVGWSAISAAGTAQRTGTTVDVSGPCDEAEHANDPECTGISVRPEDEASPQDEASPDDEVGEDISGPCDEAEHANDPRCTGAGGTVEDREDDDRDDAVEDRHEDRSGPSDDGGSGSEDRSGSNSGRG